MTRQAGFPTTNPYTCIYWDKHNYSEAFTVSTPP